jgi:hypothetical protein
MNNLKTRIKPTYEGKMQKLGGGGEKRYRENKQKEIILA